MDVSEGRVRVSPDIRESASASVFDSRPDAAMLFESLKDCSSIT
jgi:hypothetical protein